MDDSFIWFLLKYTRIWIETPNHAHFCLWKGDKNRRASAKLLKSDFIKNNAAFLAKFKIFKIPFYKSLQNKKNGSTVERERKEELVTLTSNDHNFA